MLKEIHSYIEKHRLLEKGKTVIVGLSGGADSVALLAILTRLGYPCIALHGNFHLRGEESMRDEAFARELAATFSVPFHKMDFNTQEFASEKRISIEMAARELRYAWFEEQRVRLGAQAIAVAHHRDDNTETLILNLIRGTGIRGIRGIRPRNSFVVRPLLSVGRQEIIDWLKKERLDYMTDSTNLCDTYTRNFIRLRVLPLLEEINPAAKQTIARTAEHLAASEAIYLHAIEEIRQKAWNKNCLNTAILRQYPASETLLFEMLQPYGFSRLVCQSIFSTWAKEPGRLFFSPDWKLVTGKDYLQVFPLSEKEEEIPLSYQVIEGYNPDSFQIENSRSVAYFDYDKLQEPLSLRHWKEGDWFIPFGMKGKKKVSDYLKDRKYNRLQRESVWLLMCGETIIWLVNERPDNRFRLTPKTKRVLLVKIQDKK